LPIDLSSAPQQAAIAALRERRIKVGASSQGHES